MKLNFNLIEFFGIIFLYKTVDESSFNKFSGLFNEVDSESYKI